jgi:hypothetical protein
MMTDATSDNTTKCLEGPQPTAQNVLAIKAVAEQLAANRASDEIGERKRARREIASTVLLLLTVVLTLATLIDTHVSSERQHAETRQALNLANDANQISQNTASEQAEQLAAQVSELKNSNSISRETLTVTQRAYLTVSLSVSPAKSGDQILGYLARPIVENNGRTAAVNVRLQMIETPASFSQIHFHENGARLARDPTEVERPFSIVKVSEGIVWPGTKWDGNTSEFAQALQGQSDRETDVVEDFIWGTVRYRDIFPGTSEHAVEFCFYVPNPGKQTLASYFPSPSYCVGHNCVDGQCVDRKSASDAGASGLRVPGLPDLSKY